MEKAASYVIDYIHSATGDRRLVTRALTTIEKSQGGVAFFLEGPLKFVVLFGRIRRGLENIYWSRCVIF